VPSSSLLHESTASSCLRATPPATGSRRRWLALPVAALVLWSGAALPAASARADGTLARGRSAAVAEDPCSSPPVLGHGFDRYGGWKGLRRRATGRFTVRKLGRGFALFSPLGHVFYASGATGIEPTGDYVRDTTSAPYHDAIIARYGNEAAWADATFARLCRLGMRTIGGWVSLPDVERFAGQLAYTVNIHVTAALPEVPTAPSSLRPRRDVFVADAPARVRAYVHSQPLVLRCARDPWCIGVFVDNEYELAPALFAGGSHLDVYLSQPADAAGKRALQSFFERRYRGSLRRFNATWGTALRAWSEIQQLVALGDCPPTPGWTDDLCVLGEPARRFADRMAFEALVAGRSARLADRALDEIEPAMLNLGPRLVVAPYARPLLRAIARHVDVLSVNNYDVRAVADAILTPAQRARMAQLGLLGFDPFERLHQLAETTRKPLWISEWFYRQARPGVSSYPPFLPERPDASSRAAAAAAYLDAILAMPFVVGDSWFQWQDQPLEGRFDGENQLIGIVDIDDNLNQPLADTLARLYGQAIARRFGSRR